MLQRDARFLVMDRAAFTRLLGPLAALLERGPVGGEGAAGMEGERGGGDVRM